jgi:hypothetical protein
LNVAQSYKSQRRCAVVAIGTDFRDHQPDFDSKSPNRNLIVMQSQSAANKLPHAITVKVIQRGEIPP